MAAIRNATSEHSSLNLRKTLPAFLIIPTLPSRLKFTRKPAILTMKTKTKMIQPSQKLRIIAAEATSCQRSPRTTKRRCLSRIGCYLNSYSNNKPNGRRREPEWLSELDRSRATAKPENPGNQSKIFKMVDPLRYCGGAKELDKFLETLRSNFASHKHLFPRGDPDQVNDRRKIRTHPSGLATYERPRTRV